MAGLSPDDVGQSDQIRNDPAMPDMDTVEHADGHGRIGAHLPLERRPGQTRSRDHYLGSGDAVAGHIDRDEVAGRIDHRDWPFDPGACHGRP